MAGSIQEDWDNKQCRGNIRTRIRNMRPAQVLLEMVSCFDKKGGLSTE